MPLYEYECRECGGFIRTLQSYKEDPLTDCSECDAKDSLTKLISTPGAIIFKGDGWCTPQPSKGRDD
jgi:putative FmdB family regulatory protein